MALHDPLMTNAETESRGSRRGAFVVVAVSAFAGALLSLSVGAALICAQPGLANFLAKNTETPLGLAASVATASDAAFVQKSFFAWGAGDFVGNDARANVANFYNEDAIFDFTANIDEPLYKVYYGHDGVMDLCQNLLTLKFLHFTPTMSLGPDGTIMARVSYGTILLSTDMGATGYADFMQFRMKGGRISYAKIFWGDQKQMNKQWSSETILPVQTMMKAWGAGMLTGPDAATVTSKFFTSDVVFDATAEVAGTNMYKVYYGVDGIQDWTQFISAFQYDDFTPAFFAGSQRGTVMAQLSYGLTYKPTGKSTPGKINDMMLFKVVDGKISYAKLFFGAPAAIEHTMQSN